MISRYSLDVPRIFAGFFQDVFWMLQWVLWAWWNLMNISNERNSIIPNYLMIPAIRWSPAIDDRLEVWTLIIQNSTVIPPSLMVLFSVVNNHVQTWIWWFGSFSASLDSLRIQEGQFWVLGTFVSFFSCPAQLNRWPCHSLSEWVRSLLISEHYNH